MRWLHDGYPLGMATMLRCSTYVVRVNFNKGGFAMFDRLKSAVRRFNLPTIAEVERDYLNAALSLVDLERRQREVERGLFRKSSFDL
jgi:hypothetical protein